VCEAPRGMEGNGRRGAAPVGGPPGRRGGASGARKSQPVHWDCARAGAGGSARCCGEAQSAALVFAAAVGPRRPTRPELRRAAGPARRSSVAARHDAGQGTFQAGPRKRGVEGEGPCPVRGSLGGRGPGPGAEPDSWGPPSGLDSHRPAKVLRCPARPRQRRERLRREGRGFRRCASGRATRPRARARGGGRRLGGRRNDLLGRPR